MSYKFTKDHLVLFEVVGQPQPGVVITHDRHSVPLAELAEALAPFLAAAPAPTGDKVTPVEPTRPKVGDKVRIISATFYDREGVVVDVDNSPNPFLVQIDPGTRAWFREGAVVPIATVTPVEPTEEEWRKAFMVTDDEPFSTFCARMTAEARRLAALRKEER